MSIYVCMYIYMHTYIHSLHCNYIMHKKTATKEFQNTNFRRPEREQVRAAGRAELHCGGRSWPGKVQLCAAIPGSNREEF